MLTDAALSKIFETVRDDNLHWALLHVPTSFDGFCKPIFQVTGEFDKL